MDNIEICGSLEQGGEVQSFDDHGIEPVIFGVPGRDDGREGGARLRVARGEQGDLDPARYQASVKSEANCGP